MAHTVQLNTKDETLREILSNGKKYVVPKFQRDYSWKREQWEILWEDITNVANTKEYHYMGYLVIQVLKDKSNISNIIDGQQRLTTFSLLVLAAIKRLREINGDKDSERADEFLRNFIGTKDLVYLRVESKLTLNRNNRFHYRQATEEKEIQKYGQKKTVHLMAQALEYFKESFNKYDNGEEIAKLIEQTVDKLLFTIISIGNELNAYKIFETLNARGVQLSSSDLLKNHIFSLMDEDENIPDEVVDELEEQWEKIGSNIGDKHYTDYMIHQWNSCHELIRRQALFQHIRKDINDKEKAKKYLDTLEEQSIVYSAILTPESELWKDHPNHVRIKEDLAVLKLFNIRQPISLLLISYETYKDKNTFATILHWMMIFSLRYNVICRLHPGEQENLYSKICIEIYKGCEIKTIKEMIARLYPNDKDFTQAFTDKSMPTEQSNKKVRHLLKKLYDHEPDINISEEDATVEHILPLKPDETWQHDFGSNWKKYNTRIGNMILVDTKTNKTLGQKCFNEKKTMLSKSNYTINKDIALCPEWTSNIIETQQGKLANIAVDVWKITDISNL